MGKTPAKVEKPVRKTFYILGSVVFFFSFVCFSFLVHKNLLNQFDFNTTVRLQDHLPRRFDTLFSYFSVFGRFEVCSLLLLVLLIFHRKWKSWLLWLPFLFILFFELYGKIFVTHPGPPFRFARYQSLVMFPSDYVPHPTYSYPSGHSGRTLFLAVLLLFLIYKSKRLSLPVKGFLSILLLSYVVTMCISRIYLGEHWTTDVIGGFILGISMGIAGVVLL